ncbi:hypothetical protein HNQ91_000677 [Filimonas zeae]|uniref:Uncharacterized protein n=1 Tax=Filimonas zeae TaxID=1737353 RepID=A0A917MRH4_9BACT|nr:hypothetical protein [Filimonas zeae]MDR6337655.1 hypothetical protein [Filimonas zeae]GGH59656.1 hypothetical protein GCM10011379_06670 [Filimonas zeae]
MLECSIPRYSRQANSLREEATEYIFDETVRRGSIQFYLPEDIRLNPRLSKYPKFLFEISPSQYIEAIIHTIEYDTVKRHVAVHGTALNNLTPEAVTLPLDQLRLTQILYLADYLSTYMDFQKMRESKKVYAFAFMQQHPYDFPFLALFDKEPQQVLNAYEYSERVYIVEYLKDKIKDTQATFIVLTDWMQPESTTLKGAEEAAFELMANELVEDFEAPEEPDYITPPPTAAEILMQKLFAGYTA